MGDAARQDAFSVKQLESLVRNTQSTALNPNDALVQISWPLILILAISAIIVAQQQEAIDQANVVVGQLTPDKKEIVLELWKLLLLRRIDAVCRDVENQWNLPLFPVAERISYTDGWPEDQHFQQLCRQTSAELQDLTSLVHDLYRAALSNSEDGHGPMYDTVIDPFRVPGTLQTPNVLDDSDNSAARRKFALDHIEQRCNTWRQHIVTLQRKMVLRTLVAEREGGSTRLQVGSPAEVTKQIRKEFVQRGYPLLEETL